MSGLNDIFKEEIARELLLEKDPNLTETTFDMIWGLCQGNAWNAPALYEILKVVGKI